MMDNQEDKDLQRSIEITEIRKLADQLKTKLLGSIWYKEYYEKAMTEKGNSNYLLDRNCDDIVFDFDEMSITTFPHYEQNSSNLILNYGYQLDEEREARHKRLATISATQEGNKNNE